jgi:hypothetical protein
MSHSSSLACSIQEQPMTIPPTNPTNSTGPAGPGSVPATPLFAEDDEWDLVDREVPSEAELAGLWPDPFAGRPDGEFGWLGELSGPELEALVLAEERAGREAEAAAAVVPAGFAGGAVLDVLEPDRVLAGVVQDVCESGLGRLADDELVGVLGAARRLASWQAAVEFRVVAELDARRRPAGGVVSSRAGEQVSAELAAALRLTGRSADALLGLARELVRLPSVLAALAAGVIDRGRAAVFAAELAGLGDVAAAAVAAAFWRPAGSMTTSALRAALRSMVLWLDPEAGRRRAERGRADARVESWQEGSGNGGLAGRELPAGEAIAADRRIAAIARALKEAGAAGTMDQLRAAVFTALLTGQDPAAMIPPAGPAGRDHGGGTRDHANRGRGAGDRGVSSAAGVPLAGEPGWLAAMTGSVHLTMPLAAFTGQSDAPGEAAGLGPVDAGTCRDLAARLAAGPATSWSVTLTGPDGRAVAHARAGPGRGPGPPGAGAGDLAGWLAGLRFNWLERGGCAHSRQTAAYRPGRRLRELVVIRHRTCGFPGCRRPAARCDLDHTIPFDQGGATCECNLAPLCRQHHQVKQALGWQLTQPEPGVLTWTAPHGRSYVVMADRYPV